MCDLVTPWVLRGFVSDEGGFSGNFWRGSNDKGEKCVTVVRVVIDERGSI